MCYCPSQYVRSSMNSAIWIAMPGRRYVHWICECMRMRVCFSLLCVPECISLLLLPSLSSALSLQCPSCCLPPSYSLAISWPCSLYLCMSSLPTSPHPTPPPTHAPIPSSVFLFAFRSLSLLPSLDPALSLTFCTRGITCFRAFGWKHRVQLQSEQHQTPFFK